MRKCFVFFIFLLTPLAFGAQDLSEQMDMGAWIGDTELPTFEEFIRVITLVDYNTRVVVIGTLLLGLAGGIIGTFMLLRKRSLVADAVSHATLPGIGIAFMIMVSFGGDGKFLPGLLLGALVSGLLGMGFITFIRKVSRIKEDAALGIVLSVFFGLGVAILGVIQKMSQGSAAGLESFIYGKTASMVAMDAWLIGIASFVIVVSSFFLFKEFNILCFDSAYAASQGFPVTMLDFLMMSLVVGVTVIGLQAVGLILVIALLIIPPASARFWTDSLKKLVAVSSIIGALSGLVGATLSALIPKLPAGAIIVVCAFFFFAVSFLAGRKRGLLHRVITDWHFNRKVNRQNLLRALFEYGEVQKAAEHNGVPLDYLLKVRSWSRREFDSLTAESIKLDLICILSNNTYHLTSKGRAEARLVVRNHRLWELYLIKYADVATSKVDRGADMVEHILGPELVEELEKIFANESPHLLLPASEHNLTAAAWAKSGKGGSL